MTSAGAGGFAKGFANGFVTTFTAAQQRRHEQDQLTLKSRLDQLREDAETRKKKQETEQEAIANGQRFADMVGAKDFAPRAAEMFRMGMTADQVLSEWPNYRKKTVPDQEVEVRNPDTPIKAPVTNNMVMPAGVNLDATNATQTLPQEDLTAEAKLRGIPVEEAQDSLVRADATIKAAGIQTTPLNDDVQKKRVEQKMAQVSDGWEYVSPTKKEKFPDLAEAYFEMNQAKASGNMEKYAKMQSIVKSYSYAKGLEKVNDPTVHQFAQLDKNGKFLTYFDGQIMEDPETGTKRYYNLDTGKFQDGNIRYIPKDVYSDTGKVIERFEGRSEKYNIRRAKFTSSLEGSAQMIEIVQNYGLPNTIVGRMTADAKGLVEEARAGLSLFEKEAKSAIDNEDYDAVREQANALSEKAKNLISQGIKNEADAVIIFETYKTALVYDLAAAKGETGQSLNAKDIENFKSQLTAKDGPTLQKQINAALSSVWRGLEAERVGLNMDAGGEVAEQERKLGFSLDYKKARYENFLSEMYQDNPKMLEKVAPIFKSINKGLDNTAANSTSPEEVNQPDTTPVEIEVNGRKVTTGKPYKSKSGQIGTFNANGEWVPQN